MQAIFFVCALVGGTVMVLQFVMTVFGFGADADAGGDLGGDMDLGGHVATPDADGAGSGDVTDALDSSHHNAHSQHHHGSNWFFVKLTFQTVVAAVAFFGLGGMAAASSGMEPWTSVLIAAAAGIAALYIVYWLMELLHQFNSDGSLQMTNAIGLRGTVYLSIPPDNSGIGKITLNLQNRTVELAARTAEPQALSVGASVVVLKLAGPGLVEVGAAHETVDD